MSVTVQQHIVRMQTCGHPQNHLSKWKFRIDNYPGESWLTGCVTFRLERNMGKIGIVEI